MPLRDDDGIPISARRIPREPVALPDDVIADAEPGKELSILRVQQATEAWCYAACAEMVINHIHGGGRVEQCLVAGFVKSSPGDEVDCCPDGSQDERCTESGCAVGDFALIFDQWEVAFTAAAEMDEEDEELGASILDIVSLAILELEHEAKRPVQVRVEWNDTGAHALLVTGVDGTQVHVIDPLEGDRYGGWHEYSFLRDGFGQGNWTQTWPGLMKK